MMGKGSHGNIALFGKGGHKYHKKAKKFLVHSSDDPDGINKNVNVERRNGKLNPDY